MGFLRHARQYWPLVVVTVAIASGLPFMSNSNGIRPGLRGVAGRGGGLSLQDDLEMSEDLNKLRSGYQRPPGVLPFYGFDEINLQSPLFRSWWDGKLAASKLRELNANTVVLGQIWKDSGKFHDTVARLHGNGVKVVVQVTDVSDWVDVGQDPIGKPKFIPNTFVVGRASHVLAQARNQGVGRFADFIILGGDALAFATQRQRQEMYQIVKQYFPGTPLVRRYGLDLEHAEALHGQSHPMGGGWDEYRFGQDECDIALVEIGRGVDEENVGVRIGAVLEQLNHAVSIVKGRASDVAVVVDARFAGDRSMRTSKAAMWSTKEIDQFISAILTSAAVDGLVFRGLGSHHFDLGNPDFIAQRMAFRQAAPVAQHVEGGVSRVPAGE